MSETAHTPGPWQIADSTLGDTILSTWAVYHTPESGQRKIVANAWQDDGYTSAIHDPECLANARLIAAAPKLLEACEHAREALTVRADYWQNDVEQYGYLLDALKALVAAIAKASTSDRRASCQPSKTIPADYIDRCRDSKC